MNTLTIWWMILAEEDYDHELSDRFGIDRGLYDRWVLGIVKCTISTGAFSISLMILEEENEKTPLTSPPPLPTLPPPPPCNEFNEEERVDFVHFHFPPSLFSNR